jgi:hypothetical protein
VIVSLKSVKSFSQIERGFIVEAKFRTVAYSAMIDIAEKEFNIPASPEATKNSYAENLKNHLQKLTYPILGADSCSAISRLIYLSSS